MGEKPVNEVKEKETELGKFPRRLISNEIFYDTSSGKMERLFIITCFSPLLVHIFFVGRASFVSRVFFHASFYELYTRKTLEL